MTFRPPRTFPISLFLALASLVAVSCSARALPGTVVEPLPSPDFRLVDAVDGRRISLDDLKGSPVVVAFFYVNCGDTCPLVAAKLREVSARLEKDKVKAAIVAITVDPEGDTAQAVQKFTADRGLTGKWSYLIGAKSDLVPVWAGFGIGVGPQGASTIHTDAIWLLDKTGARRVLLRSDFVPDDLVEHLKRL